MKVRDHRTAPSSLSRRARALAAAAVILSLGGCASPDGIAPTGRLLEPGGPQPGSSTPVDPSPVGETWPVAEWWRGLGDPQLDRLVGEALEGAPDLAAADARMRAARAALLSADAARGPTLDATGRVTGYRRSGDFDGRWPDGSDTATTKEASLDVAWNIDLWGGERASWEAAAGRARAAEIDSRAARIELSIGVGRAYARLGYAFARQDVAMAERARTRAVLDLTGQRVARGVGDRLSLRRAEGELAEAEQRVDEAAQAIYSARITLAILLGKGPDRGRDIARPPVLTPGAVAVPADLPAGLIGHRADLVAARWRVEAAGRDIEAAKAAFLPNISITGLAGFSSLDAQGLFGASALSYRFGPAVSLPLFDAGRRRAGLAGRDADYDLAVAHYNGTLIAALNAVADRLAELRSIAARVGAGQRAVDAATAAWNLAEARYRGGVGSFLEALSVRRQLLAAQEQLAALRAGQVDCSLQLIEALGGGYQPGPADRPAVARASSPF